MRLKFTWDPQKAEENFRRHGIRFEKAISAFNDPLRFRYPDPSDVEERWRLLGMTENLLLLFVVHTIRETDDTEIVRIISARKVTPQERRRYERR